MRLLRDKLVVAEKDIERLKSCVKSSEEILKISENNRFLILE